jgi:hypothetical protein
VFERGAGWCWGGVEALAADAYGCCMQQLTVSQRLVLAEPTSVARLLCEYMLWSLVSLSVPI